MSGIGSMSPQEKTETKNNFKSTEERMSMRAGFIAKDPRTGEERIQNESYLLMDLQQEISDLLNRLEYFCMTCRYGLADEKILYQSLHATFISLVFNESGPHLVRNTGFDGALKHSRASLVSSG